MKLHDNGQRNAFTLIELLVVMAIIATLASLISAGVFATLRQIENVRSNSDISQMSTGLNSFKSYPQWQLTRYPPSRIKLSETGNYPQRATPGTPDHESVVFLNAWRPRLTFPVDWNGDGAFSGDWILEGDQALVFFLGGIPRGTPPVPSGFSDDPRNPANFGTGTTLIPGFFEFRTNRLVNPGHTASPRFLSYLDPYGKNVYAYFSTYRKANEYMAGDCALLRVNPYFEAGTGPPTTIPIRFHNVDTFQILCAGRDGAFGPGGPWSPRSATAIPPAGRDDHSNFHSALMGVNNN